MGVARLTGAVLTNCAPLCPPQVTIPEMCVASRIRLLLTLSDNSSLGPPVSLYEYGCSFSSDLRILFSIRSVLRYPYVQPTCSTAAPRRCVSCHLL